MGHLRNSLEKMNIERTGIIHSGIQWAFAHCHCEDRVYHITLALERVARHFGESEHSMGYFDDIEFIASGSAENYCYEINRSFPGTFSIEFIAGGRMRSSIDSSPAVVIDTPSLFWHHPRFHYKYGPCDGKGWHHHWILMRGERARRLVEEALIPNFRNGFAPISSPKAVHEDFHSLLVLVAYPSRYRQPEAVALLETLVAKTLCMRRQNSVPTPFDELFEHIKCSPGKDWDFSAISRKMGVSSGHFRRLFKNQSGRSPKDFILHCKVTRAVELLTITELRIKEIALQSGFVDQETFSKTFKSRTGLSPKAYRARKG
jgi:AraC-like DNA-binding protein